MALNKTADKFNRLLSLMDADNTLSKEDFLKAFENVVKLVKNIEAKHLKAIADLIETYKRLERKLNNDSDTISKSSKADILREARKIQEAIQNKLAPLEKRIAELKDGEPGKDANEDAVADNVLNRIRISEISGIDEDLPKLGQSIRDALELLQGEERLRIEAIDGLDDKLKELEETRSKGGNSVGGLINTVRYHDLSDQLDGTTKTFNVPSFRVAVQLSGTQFPIVYRPGTDFTTGNKTITLTDEVSAPESGQSLILLYIK